MVGEIGEILKQEEYKGYTITIERTPEDVVVQLMNNGYEDMPWLYVTNKNVDFGKDVGAKRTPYSIDSDEEAEQAFGDSYILPFYSYTSPHGSGCQEVSAGNANGFLVFEKDRYHRVLNNNDPHGWLLNCLTYLEEVLDNERWSVVIYRPDGELTECWESFWGDEEDKQNAIKYAESSVDTTAKWSADREDEQFDKFWNARGDISDSVRRRVKDSDEPYHGVRYQIVVWSNDIDYDEKYDSDDLNELKQDVKEFLKTEDEVGIVDYETGEWVYIHTKDGMPAYNLEKVYPLSANLKRKQQSKTERMNSRYAEKDWLS